MFSIIGVKKHKAQDRLIRTLRHHLREGVVPNADPAQLAKNVRAGQAGDAAAVAAALLARVEPLVKRKDAVKAIELNLAASPEWFQRRGGTGTSQELWDAAKAFLRATFGRENVIAFGMHRDETSPHVWAVVTPIHEGKLRASHWLDGRKKLAELHDQWADATKHLGLRRGASKSGAKHVDVQTYYAAVKGQKSARETVSREMSRRIAVASDGLEQLEGRERKAAAMLAELDLVGQERAQVGFLARLARVPQATPKNSPDKPSGLIPRL